MAISFPYTFAYLTNILTRYWDDNFAAINAALGAANGIATLNSSSLVVQDPANAVTTATASKIVKRDGSGRIIDHNSQTISGVGGTTYSATGTGYVVTLDMGTVTNGDVFLLCYDLRITGSALADCGIYLLKDSGTATIVLGADGQNIDVKNLSGNSWFMGTILLRITGSGTLVMRGDIYESGSASRVAKLYAYSLKKL